MKKYIKTQPIYTAIQWYYENRDAVDKFTNNRVSTDGNIDIRYQRVYIHPLSWILKDQWDNLIIVSDADFKKYYSKIDI